MSVFAIISVSHKPALKPAIEREFAGNFREINPTSFIVVAKGTSEEVFAQLGMHKSEKREFSGVLIVRITSDYYGRSKTEFWEWLADAFGDGDG